MLFLQHWRKNPAKAREFRAGQVFDSNAVLKEEIFENKVIYIEVFYVY